MEGIEFEEHMLRRILSSLCACVSHWHFERTAYVDIIEMMKTSTCAYRFIAKRGKN